MIEITDGFTSISAGSDSIEGVAQRFARASGGACAPRSATGARVTVEFRREISLAPAQVVRVRYDFAGDGNVREGTGIAKPVRTDVRCGRAVLYYYRLSHWIAPAALMKFAVRNERSKAPVWAKRLRGNSSPPILELVDGATAIDPFRA